LTFDHNHSDDNSHDCGTIFLIRQHTGYHPVEDQYNLHFGSWFFEYVPFNNEFSRFHT